MTKNKWDEKELIDLFYFFVDESDHFWTKEEAEDQFKLVRKIKKQAGYRTGFGSSSHGD